MILSDTLAYMGVHPAGSAGADTADMVDVPELTGLGINEANAALRESGLTGLMDGVGQVVVDELPKAGAQMTRGSQVIMYLEQQQTQDATVVEVPGCKRHVDQSRASRLIASCALSLKIEGSGLAGEQTPAAGTRVPVGTQVSVQFRLP